MIDHLKLKTLRTNQHLTQEGLAELSGISIRTIQRIEKGLSKGSAHTAKALAAALAVDPQRLTATAHPEPASPTQGMHHVILMNLSILGVLMVPFGNLIFPGLIYFTYQKDDQMQRIGKRIFRFQLIVTLVLFYLTFLIFMNIGRGSGAIPTPVIICYLMYTVVSLVVVTLTHLHITKTEQAPKFFPSFI